jgi:predicted Zn-dependent peptidase
VVEHRLENGWLFLLLPRHDAPVVSFETYVAAGAVHDPAGLSGMAHLVKNMLFKGSARLGSRDWAAESAALAEVDAAHAAWALALAEGAPQAQSAARTRLESARRRAAELVLSEEFSRVLEDAGCGASLNAYTDEDSTRFVVSLPSNQLEKWCWMESERFRAPVFREFYVERDALLEDRLGRVETDALGRLSEELRASAYGDHPLGRPVLGTEASLRRFDRPTALAFFRERYGARSLTTSIVGDFDPGALLALLDAYFESVPQGPAQLPAPPPVPEPQGERRVFVAFDAEPVLAVAWHVPPKAHPDSPAVELAVRLLGYARSSRLEKHLIRDTGLASELFANPAWQGDRYAALATVRCVPNTGVPPEDVERALYQELEGLRESGPSREELAGAKRVAAADHIRSLRSNAAIAAGLNDCQVECGDWREFFDTDKRLSAVTNADVQRVLRTWFDPARRSVATIVPREVPR